MKKLKLVLVALIVGFSTQVNAQTAEEVIDNYLETIGGKENLMKVKSLKMTGTISVQGMTIPIVTATKNDGSVYFEMEMQGMKMKQLISNGDKVWTMSQMTQKMEEMPSDMASTMIEEFKDFPNAFVDYKNKGYKIELVGTETEEGTECFKIKLTKKPVTIEGETVPNVSFFYFEKENFVPIVVESEVPSGPAKGQMNKVPLSDYQEVDGLYFPFSTKIQGMAMTYTKIEINPEIDPSEFEVKN